MDERIIQQAVESLQALERERAPPPDEEFEQVFTEVDSFFERIRRLRNNLVDEDEVSGMLAENLLKHFSQDSTSRYLTDRIDYDQYAISEGLTPETYCESIGVSLSGEDVHIGLRIMYAGRGRMKGVSYLDIEEEYHECLKVIEVASSPERDYCFIRYCEEFPKSKMGPIECIYTKTFGRHPEGYISSVVENDHTEIFRRHPEKGIPSLVEDDCRMEEVNAETAMIFVNRVMNEQLSLREVEQQISTKVRNAIMRR